jgi:hypothetical protein
VQECARTAAAGCAVFDRTLTSRLRIDGSQWKSLSIEYYIQLHTSREFNQSYYKTIADGNNLNPWYEIGNSKIIRTIEKSQSGTWGEISEVGSARICTRAFSPLDSYLHLKYLELKGLYERT